MFFQILLYDIIEVVPEPGKPMTKYKFKEVLTKEQKGPVSAITHVVGFLVTAVGQKVRFVFEQIQRNISLQFFFHFILSDLLMATQRQ